MMIAILVLSLIAYIVRTIEYCSDDGQNVSAPFYTSAIVVVSMWAIAPLTLSIITLCVLSLVFIIQLLIASTR